MLEQLIVKIKDNQEIFLVFIVVVVVMLMILPVPPWLMDIVIGFNLSLSIFIVMTVIFIKSSIGISSFPSILLFLALMRIGITLSSSRAILGRGDTGEIVHTFGTFVLGGQILVGVISFSTLTLINFIVITKGSERVAEVAARFSLDAMPGKQMSIDSDMRAGTITKEQADQKRDNLYLESQLFGAMDGAMKFVKGDAIASIVDIFINIIGGMVIGTMQNGLTMSEAAHKYMILTVGDGLVQQIPAVLVSVSSGIMITRVDGQNQDSKLGRNIIKQVFGDYRVLFAGALILILICFVPGMPSMVFFTLGSIAVSGGIIRRKFLNLTDKAEKNPERVIEDREPQKNVATVNYQPDPLVLYLSTNLKSSQYYTVFKNILVALQNEMVTDLGIMIPHIIIRYNDQFKQNQFQLFVYEIPVDKVSFVYNNHVLILTEDEEMLSTLNMKNSIPNKLAFTDDSLLGTWVTTNNISICKEFNIPYLLFDNVLTLYLKKQLKGYIANFLGMQEVKEIFDKMAIYQELIRELLKMLPLNKITEVFQRLVMEDVSIRNFKLILDSMLETAQKEKDVVIITEYVRRSLGRYISYKFSNGSYVFSAVITNRGVEDILRNAIRFSENGSYLELDEVVKENLITQIKTILKSNKNAKNVIILTNFDVRPYIVSIIKGFVNAPVLSIQEIEEYAQFSCLGVLEKQIDEDDDI
jgi:type III secretion protein V